VRITTRNPQFRVKLVTQKLGEFDFDSTHASVVQLMTRKRMGHAAGEFRLELVPRKLSNIPNAGGWHDIVEPMDYVEIFMWVPPRTPDRPVMRGFIDTVAEEFDIASGTPQRRITITGRDYGKLLLITKLYDIVSDAVGPEMFRRFTETFRKLFGLSASDPNALPPSESPAMGSGQTTDGPAYTPTRMLRTIFEGFYAPQETEILATFNNQLPGMDLVSWVTNDPWEERLRTLSPTFFQRASVPFTDTWALMSAYQHKPWRELFVAEEVDQPLLIYRPAPWLDLNGDFVQDVSKVPLRTWPIHETDVINSTLMRTEQQLKNFFFTFPEQYAHFATIMKETPRSLEGFFSPPFLQSNPYLEGWQRAVSQPGEPPFADFRRFGFRLAEYSTPYLDWERNTKYDTLPAQIADERVQGREWNMRAVRAFHFDHLLENGSFTLKGDERIQAGDYLRLEDRGRALGGVAGTTTGGPRYYVEGVTQQFVQGTTPSDGHFVTLVEVSQGRGHLVRVYQERG
jgi:hypothetical protein